MNPRIHSFASGALAVGAAIVMVSGAHGGGEPSDADLIAQLSDIEMLAAAVPPVAVAAGGEYRVIDGESLVLGYDRIRLRGIEAPATEQRCSTPSGGQWDCAAATTERLRSIMRGAAQVECYSNERDVYGRHLATCEADGRDVAMMLVEEGLVWPARYRSTYEVEGETAQGAGLGVWQAPTPAPWEWRRARRGK
ncbi:thermonuclease family protein [Roseobacteraceae bacterium NS-SX3]